MSPRRSEALQLLEEWRSAERVAEGYELLASRSDASRITAEVCRREANDLRDRILTLMGVTQLTLEE